MNATDNSLMEEVSRGQVSQLAVLFERHHRALFRFFISLNRDRALSEDLVQDVFFRILRYRASYQAVQPFTAWMYQIARNTSVDHFRKNSRRDQVRFVAIDDSADRQQLNGVEPESVAASTLASDGADPEEQLAQRRDRDLLQRALDQLPQEKRELLILSRLQGLKYAEIAQVLGCETATVKVRVFRAMRALEQMVTQISPKRAGELAVSRTAGELAVSRTAGELASRTGELSTMNERVVK